uniref:F-box associated beta-propeller type 3 domain-containing protein n=1 Tax=Arundo donax TaxID=35708 RepID=A0A0A9HJA4_ARUDO
MDLSGSVIKRVYRTWDKKERMMSTHRDIICTTKGGIFLDIRRFRLLNPSNGAVYALPEGNAHELDIGNYNTTLVFGQVATTREYKMLRLLKSCFLVLSQEQTQLCEVFTFNGCIGARWRRKKACLFRFDRLSDVVVNGIVYFFLDEDFQEQDVACKCIVSFDLGTEEWRVTHRGPLITLVGNAVDIPDSHIGYHKISMADLNGCLVVVHCNLSSMDLWYLMDFQKSLWVKKHSIQVNLSFQRHEFEVQPLLVLNDGRIVTHIETKGLLRIYNPRTSTYTDVAEMGPRSGVGLYTGNLLSLASTAS